MLVNVIRGETNQSTRRKRRRRSIINQRARMTQILTVMWST